MGSEADYQNKSLVILSTQNTYLYLFINLYNIVSETKNEKKETMS